jgi:hypothetical protein
MRFWAFNPIGVGVPSAYGVSAFARVISLQTPRGGTSLLQNPFNVFSGQHDDSFLGHDNLLAARIEKSRVSVSIGVALPAAVALYDLPPDVIVVSGACPIKYFVWGDDIVLVDSCTRHVVEIIPGVA